MDDDDHTTIDDFDHTTMPTRVYVMCVNVVGDLRDVRHGFTHSRRQLEDARMGVSSSQGPQESRSASTPADAAAAPSKSEFEAVVAVLQGAFGGGNFPLMLWDDVGMGATGAGREVAMPRVLHAMYGCAGERVPDHMPCMGASRCGARERVRAISCAVRGC